jgi:hypothetical protein
MLRRDNRLRLDNHVRHDVRHKVLSDGQRRQYRPLIVACRDNLRDNLRDDLRDDPRDDGHDISEKMIPSPDRCLSGIMAWA